MQQQAALLSVIVMVCDSVVVTDDFSYPCGGREGGFIRQEICWWLWLARRKSVITVEQNETCWQIYPFLCAWDRTVLSF